MKLVDPNGEEIVGTDNKAVSYSYDNQGNVVWSSNASDDTKRIGNAIKENNVMRMSVASLSGRYARITYAVRPREARDTALSVP